MERYRVHYRMAREREGTVIQYFHFRVLKFPLTIDAGRAARAPPPAPVLRMRAAAYAGGQVRLGVGIDIFHPRISE